MTCYISGPNIIPTNATLYASSNAANHDVSNLAAERWKAWRSTETQPTLFVDFDNEEGQAVNGMLLNDVNLTQSATIEWDVYGNSVFSDSAFVAGNYDVIQTSGTAVFNGGKIEFTAFHGSVTPKHFEPVDGASYMNKSTFDPGWIDALPGFEVGDVSYAHDGYSLVLNGFTGDLNDLQIKKRVGYQSADYALGPLEFFGGKDWSSFGWGGHLPQSELSSLARNVFFEMPTSSIVTHVKMLISDSTNPDGYIQARELFAGLGTRYNLAYGYEPGYEDTSKMGEVTRTGLRYVAAEGRIKRKASLTSSGVKKPRLLQYLVSSGMKAGRRHPVILSLDPDGDLATRQHGTFLAEYTRESKPKISSYNHGSINHEFTEVIL